MKKVCATEEHIYIHGLGEGRQHHLSYRSSSHTHRTIESVTTSKTAKMSSELSPKFAPFIGMVSVMTKWTG